MENINWLNFKFELNSPHKVKREIVIAVIKTDTLVDSLRVSQGAVSKSIETLVTMDFSTKCNSLTMIHKGMYGFSVVLRETDSSSSLAALLMKFLVSCAVNESRSLESFAALIIWIVMVQLAVKSV